MPEAVIVSTARTPIGRAFKGSLVSARPDDLAAFAVQAALDKVPGLDPRDIDDLMLGCGQPAGEAGLQHRPRRRGQARHGLPARHDGQPLLLLLAADHPHGLPRHQGRRGRGLRQRRRRGRLPLRQRHGRLGAGRPEPRLRRGRRPAPRSAPPSPAPATGPTRARPATCPTSTSRCSRPPRTSRDWKGISRARHGRVRAPARRTSPRRPSPTASGSARSRPYTLADGTVVEQGRLPPRRRHRRGHERPQAGPAAPTAWSPPATPARSTTAPPPSSS